MDMDNLTVTSSLEILQRKNAILQIYLCLSIVILNFFLTGHKFLRKFQRYHGTRHVLTHRRE